MKKWVSHHLKKKKRGHKRNDVNIFIDRRSRSSLPPFVNFPWVYLLSREAINKLVISVYPRARTLLEGAKQRQEAKKSRVNLVYTYIQRGHIITSRLVYFHPRACRFTINSCHMLSRGWQIDRLLTDVNHVCSVCVCLERDNHKWPTSTS